MSEGSHRSSPAAAGSAGVAVVTPQAVVLLPDGASTRLVDDLWRILAQPQVAAESIVAVLPLRGPDEVASFAVVVHEAGAPDAARLQVVLRGDAVVDVDGGYDESAPPADLAPRRVDARQALPFYLATLDRVRAYRLGSASAPLSAVVADGLPVVAGAVVADAIAWRVDARASDERASGSAGGSGRRAGGGAHRASAPVDPGLVSTVLDAPSGEAFAPADPPAASASSSVPAAPVADRSASALGDPAADDEAAARARSAGVPTVAIATTPEADADADAIRIVHAVRIMRDGVPLAAGTGHPDPERIPLDVPVIVGRRPRPPRVVRGPAPRLVTVPSPLGEISGTHVALRQESGAIVVTDLDSTNGTVVLAPGVERLALRPGESLVVVPGTRVDIGDGVVLEILSAR
ncbi:hypothetical protein QFZ62_000938 [Clavibacter sp. B3I6]|uniref:FHA domain-containing protein n=1 Tax=Clavibacter sp. B3I6 TaxID=3042268 RepID=UPI00277F27FE|nr:FHA domain-containing protein [Clavibacter sp. B3I6]MDQ0743630.1 hypothetical protein [Clavibacter sp. B3I6]